MSENKPDTTQPAQPAAAQPAKPAASATPKKASKLPSKSISFSSQPVSKKGKQAGNTSVNTVKKGGVNLMKKLSGM